MKKQICLLLTVCMVFALTACAASKPAAEEKPTQEAQSQPAADGSTPAAQLANPWRGITETEAKEFCPKSFAVPDGAENAMWTVMESAADPSGMPGALVQLSFVLYENSFTAREQITGDPEADLSGMYYDWTHRMDGTLKNWSDIVCHSFRFIGEDGYADLCTWYDAESGTSYSLSVTAKDLDGFDLQAIVEALHG